MATRLPTGESVSSHIANMNLPLSTSTLALLATLLVGVVAAGTKNLPFAWHARIFRAVFIHRRRARQSSPNPGPEALFQPVRTSSGTPLSDCDYNVHKSNSTYFADLDVARVHLFGALGFASQPAGAPMPALGGVHCNFRKPVAPLQRTETYTRVLGWDEKWIYLASWVVRPDSRAAQPTAWTLQPWRKSAGGSKSADTANARTPDIYAVSIARYVFKQSRKTVAPAEVLASLGLLPTATANDIDCQAVTLLEEIEAERQRGVEFARGMASLDGLLDCLHPAEGPALAEW